jgi:hypothetical protein
MDKDRSRCKGLLQQEKGFLSCGIEIEGDTLSEELGQRSSNLGELEDKPMVEVGKPEEDLEIMD